MFPAPQEMLRNKNAHPIGPLAFVTHVHCSASAFSGPRLVLMVSAIPAVLVGTRVGWSGTDSFCFGSHTAKA